MYMMMQRGIPLFFLAFFSTFIFIKLFIHFAKTRGWVTKNYRGEEIPSGYGIVILFLFFGYGQLYFSLYPVSYKLFLLFASSLVFMGWVDDRYGNEQIKGITGHFLSFIKTGRPTTGLFKALAGGGAAVLLSLLLAQNIPSFILYSLFLALSTNFINLLDVRPGRALKTIWFILGVFFIVGTFSPLSYSLFFLLLLFSFACAFFDLTGKAMLGDAGANGLGFSLGMLAIQILPEISIGLGLLFLIFIHWYAERYSITKLIKKHAFLRRVDEWGRKPEP